MIHQTFGIILYRVSLFYALFVTRARGGGGDLNIKENYENYESVLLTPGKCFRPMQKCFWPLTKKFGRAHYPFIKAGFQILLAKILTKNLNS
jgi:hypothetical protein